MFFQLVTGARLFHGESRTEVLDSIAKVVDLDLLPMLDGIEACKRPVSNHGGCSP